MREHLRNYHLWDMAKVKSAMAGQRSSRPQGSEPKCSDSHKFTISDHRRSTVKAFNNEQNHAIAGRDTKGTILSPPSFSKAVHQNQEEIFPRNTGADLRLADSFEEQKDILRSSTTSQQPPQVTQAFVIHREDSGLIIGDDSGTREIDETEVSQELNNEIPMQDSHGPYSAIRNTESPWWRRNMAFVEKEYGTDRHPTNIVSTAYEDSPHPRLEMTPKRRLTSVPIDSVIAPPKLETSHSTHVSFAISSNDLSSNVSRPEDFQASMKSNSDLCRRFDIVKSAQNVRCVVLKEVARSWQGPQYIRTMLILRNPMQVQGANAKGDFVFNYPFSTAPPRQLADVYESLTSRIQELISLKLTSPNYVRNKLPALKSKIRQHIVQTTKTAEKSARLREKGESPRNLPVLEPNETGGSRLQVKHNRDCQRSDTLDQTSVQLRFSPSTQSQTVSDERSLVTSYKSYVMRIWNLRIELRIWSSPESLPHVIFFSFRGEPPLEEGKQRVRWRCVSFSKY